MKKEIFRQARPPSPSLAPCWRPTPPYLDINEIAAVTGRPGRRAGNAFLQPGQRDEAAGGGARATRPRPRRHGHRGRRRQEAISQGAAWWSASATASSATACWARADRRRARAAGDGGRPPRTRWTAALTDFGFRMGPFAMSGSRWASTSAWRHAQGARRQVAPRSPTRCARPAAIGQKTGARLLHLCRRPHASTPDPEVEKLVMHRLRRAPSWASPVGRSAQQEITGAPRSSR